MRNHLHSPNCFVIYGFLIGRSDLLNACDCDKTATFQKFDASKEIDTTDTPVGTMFLYVVQIMDIRANKATSTAKYEINFHSGVKIEGTMTEKIQNPMETPPDVDGKFVGHSDMHVMGIVYLKMEGTIPVLILNGYSW